MDTAKLLGKRLKQARKKAGYTQKEVGNILNMRQQAYSRYEAGFYELNYDKLKILCKLFGVSSDFLLGLDSENSDNNLD